MANVNVRFYRLETLPSFEVPKHQGIFVHVTGTMYNTPWDDLSDKEKPIRIDPKRLLITTPDIFLDKWLEKRHITQIESGLWFGGENGWELLSNETNSAAINAAINDKIATLHVDGYAQATISGSTLTISGIKEDNGIIAKDDGQKLEVAIDGGYNKDTNKIATKSTVTTAIEALDVNTAVQAVTFNTPENGSNTTLTFKGIKEVDGRIVEGDGASTFIVGDAKLKIQIGSAAASDVFSANATVDSTIKLNENVFTKNGDVISVITPTAVSESNKLVTQQDIASLNGAMHYKTTIINAGAWPTTNIKAGDVYIATGDFEYNGQSIESGDMIVFNSESATNFTVVQSNITSGTKSGQIAKNDGDLTPNYMVIATSAGIKTSTTITENTFNDDNNKRDLAYGNITGGVSIKDSLTVLGKDLEKTINITSTNKSIEIAANASENATGVVVDLVWNTIME